MLCFYLPKTFYPVEFQLLWNVTLPIIFTFQPSLFDNFEYKICFSYVIRVIELQKHIFKYFPVEKGQLLEIHLLKKTARHQNLDCSTPFEQMTKIYETAQKSKKYAVRVVSSRCKF